MKDSCVNEKESGNRFLYYSEGLACIGVVFIHCTFPSWPGALICGLCRFAVPLFFLVSGYYLFRNDTNEENQIQRILYKIRHISFLLLLSVLLYILWNFFCEFLKSGYVAALQLLGQTFQPSKLLPLLILNDFSDIGGHLWFLEALLYTYLIFGAVICLKKGSRTCHLFCWRTVVILLGIHVLARMIFALAGIDQIFEIPVYIWFRNWLFFALPFVIAGYLIRQNENSIMQKVSVKHVIMLLAIGTVLTVAESLLVYMLTRDDRELYLGSFLMIFSMFFYALCFPHHSTIPWIETIGRKYLLFVYITHFAVSEAAGILMEKSGLDQIRLLNYVKPIMVAAITVSGAVLCEKTVHSIKQLKTERRKSR